MPSRATHNCGPWTPSSAISHLPCGIARSRRQSAPDPRESGQNRDRPGILKIGVDGLLELPGGLVVVLLRAKRTPPVAQNVCAALGLLLLREFIRFAVLRDRVSGTLLIGEKEAKVVIGPGVFTINVDGLLELSLRPYRSPSASQARAHARSV
jgi:hypothetical protein